MFQNILIMLAVFLSISCKQRVDHRVAATQGSTQDGYLATEGQIFRLKIADDGIVFRDGQPVQTYHDAHGSLASYNPRINKLILYSPKGTIRSGAVKMIKDRMVFEPDQKTLDTPLQLEDFRVSPDGRYVAAINQNGLFVWEYDLEEIEANKFFEGADTQELTTEILRGLVEFVQQFDSKSLKGDSAFLEALNQLSTKTSPEKYRILKTYLTKIHVGSIQTESLQEGLQHKWKKKQPFELNTIIDDLYLDEVQTLINNKKRLYHSLTELPDEVVFKINTAGPIKNLKWHQNSQFFAFNTVNSSGTDRLYWVEIAAKDQLHQTLDFDKTAGVGWGLRKILDFNPFYIVALDESNTLIHYRWLPKSRWTSQNYYFESSRQAIAKDLNLPLVQPLDLYREGVNSIYAYQDGCRYPLKEIKKYTYRPKSSKPGLVRNIKDQLDDGIWGNNSSGGLYNWYYDFTYSLLGGEKANSETHDVDKITLNYQYLEKYSLHRQQDCIVADQPKEDFEFGFFKNYDADHAMLVLKGKRNQIGWMNTPLGTLTDLRFLQGDPAYRIQSLISIDANTLLYTSSDGFVYVWKRSS